MKILVACEWSGTVRDAFRSLGHDAVSCDILPSEKQTLSGLVLTGKMPDGETVQ